VGGREGRIAVQSAWQYVESYCEDMPERAYVFLLMTY
jgi:hypothetical protein